MCPRQPYDLDAYVERTRRGPCFICAFLSGHPDYPHHKLYEDDFAVAFLAQAPDREGRTLVQAPGYTLVAPREHREHATGSFTEQEYLRLQAPSFTGWARHCEQNCPQSASTSSL